ILLGAMVESRAEPRLGIAGSPPELSMYYSLLERPGLHTETYPGSGVYRFMDLREHADPAWRALGESVESLGERGAMVNLSRVLDAWVRPPFGLKAGVLPVLLAEVLLSREDELALYEGDMFVPELTVPTLERIAKNPHTFSVRSIPTSGLTPELVQELIPLLRQTTEGGGRTGESFADACAPQAGRPGLLGVVRPWVQFVASLPEFTQGTTQLSPQTRSIRDAVLRTSDPLRLLFEDMPKVLGREPAAEPAAFAEQVRRVLKELRTFYDPRILDEVYEAIVRAVGEDPQDPEARRRIATRTQALHEAITEHRLKAFLFRLSEERTPRNAWCESVASMVGQKPPQKWNDDDLKAFHLEVGALGRRMRSAEAAAFAPDQGADRRDGRARGGEAGISHVHLAATTATGHQYADVVRIESAAIGELSLRLADWLRENVGDAELRKAVLAQSWQDVVAETQTSEAAPAPHPSHAGV
ncbi:MAG: hypothetical protein M3P24_11200, partial [Gemmatimonadota bacterium]|nr:hypothetical protein [Gemmatimonadota bacterium]